MRNKLLWALLAVVPLAVGGLVFASSQAQSDAIGRQESAAFICPITGEELPCPKCCPLNKQTEEKGSCCSTEEKQSGQSESPFVCPLTGEELPCSKCCPLNKNH